RVVVRRTLPQALEKGRNTFTLKLEDLDPATLFSPDSSVALVSGVARPATDRDAALQHAVGQALTFVRQRADGRSDTVRATVVRVNPPQYRLTDGRFVLSEPGEPLFPAALVGPVPTARKCSSWRGRSAGFGASPLRSPSKRRASSGWWWDRPPFFQALPRRRWVRRTSTSSPAGSRSSAASRSPRPCSHARRSPPVRSSSFPARCRGAAFWVSLPP